MKPERVTLPDEFRILLVEDDDGFYASRVALLERYDPSKLDSRFAKATHDRATSQEEADSLLAKNETIPYHLVFLDLRYPLKDGNDAAVEPYQGLLWLPELRRRLPSALIVIVSAHGHEKNFRYVAEALHLGADDFLDKDHLWDEVEIRIQASWRALRHRHERDRLQVATLELLRTRAAQVHLLEAAEVVDTHVHSVNRFAGELAQSGLENAELAEELRGLAGQLASRLSQILRQAVSKHSSETSVSDVGEWLRDRLSWYFPQCRAHGVELDWVDGATLRITSYFDDLIVVIHELLQNALCAAVEGNRRNGTKGKVQVAVALSHASNATGGVSISIRDNGLGFDASDLAAKRVFEKGYSRWTEAARLVEHGGLGLGIARQLIDNLGGSLEAQNAGDGLGAVVTIHVPDLTTA